MYQYYKLVITANHGANWDLIQISEMQLCWTVAYNVTFDKNGGDTEASPKIIKCGEGLPTTNPTRTDYKFLGWYTKDGTGGDWGEEFTADSTVSEDITVYAKWKNVSIIDEIITYTALEGTSGTNNSQGHDKLVDGNKSTKWCVSNFSSAYVIFKSSEMGYVKGYTMTTGNDTATHADRNPEDWTLYGCNDYTSSGTGTWEVIHEVTGDEILQAVNTTSFDFTCDQTAIPYQYFKLEITKNSGTEKYMQLSEFALDLVKAENTVEGLTYTAKEGTSGANTSESYDKLFDGKTSTKWCVTSFSSAYVVLQSSEAGYVKGYTMSTGNDTASNKSRNPEDWTLYGCNDYTTNGTGTWEVIHQVTGDDVLQAVNTTAFDFNFEQTENSYQYFKLEITKNSGSEKCMQLSEFALNLVPACTHKLVYSSSTNPDCVNPGYKYYTCSICGHEKKILVAPLGHNFDSNRICTICGVSETSVSQPENGDGSADNPYQIAHYGNLVWFQQYVDSGNYSANAVLIADIIANKNLLNDNGEVSGTPEYTWTPISQFSSTGYATYYSGVFDGQGHTISGLYVTSASGLCALFGRAMGTIKNVFITDSYFGGGIRYNVASFVGGAYSSCVIENCGSDAAIKGDKYCGGIAGSNSGKIINCYFAGKISANSAYSNAIASDNDGGGTLTSCYYLDTCGLSSTRAESKTADEFASGEVCYLLNNGVTDGTQTWYQTIGTDALPKFEGRIVGYNESKDPQYFNACDGKHKWSEEASSTVEPTCTEDGYDIYTCTVCGLIKNVPNGRIAKHKWGETPTSTVEPTCTEDGYDIYTCTVCGLTKNVANGKTAGHKWGETPTSTVEPTCTEDGYDIYTCTGCGLTKNVVNADALGHSLDDDGICSVCDVLVALQPKNGDGSAYNPYQIANYSNLVWFQQYVDSGNYSVNAVLTADITANENLLNDSGELSGTPKYTWTPITRSGSSDTTCYSGVFDGQGHTISGLYTPPSSTSFFALFGRAKGTIKNIFITDSYFGSNYDYVGSFVGFGHNDCVIENCGSDATIIGSNYCGGIAGQTVGKITSCYFAGKISANSTYSSAIASDDIGYSTLTNCYYLDTCGLASTRDTAKTADQFASGEVCYLLNNSVTDGTQTWYQTIGTDKYPTFSGSTVYYSYNEETAQMEYANSILGNCPHSSYTNGFCDACGEVEAPELIDGKYQIASYGNLVWFQQYVDSGNYEINAVLTADITANENLLNSSGEVSGIPEYKWTPITQNAETSTSSYSGVFDGQGHTISGLYAPYSSSDKCVLFGYAKGTIKNIFITDSYFGGSGCDYAASFVGYGWSGCVIENCGSDAVVVGSYYCGGIAGETKGNITNCYFAGKISNSRSYSNAIAGDSNGYGTLTNCYYIDTCGLTSERATSMTADQFASGEVCYLLNNGVTDGTQTWYQAIGTDTLPKFEGKTVCYNESAEPQYFNAALGDVSVDNTINKADAALVLKYISSIGTLNAYQLAVADVNGDGKVDMLDAVKILDLAG